MPKKNKKKGDEKERKVKKKSGLNERDIVSYEQQISDNNKQLARLQSHNESLKDKVDVLKTQLKEMENDHSDVIAHLEYMLRQKTEEVVDLTDRFMALSELCKDEQMAHEKREAALQMEYRTMKTNLSAEIKLAAGKLNALDDWRLARLDLMSKFEIQNQQMAEQEEEHKKTLYENEKSLIIGKAKLKKEMEERLNDLAQSFRKATDIRIADATHRAVRENIAIKVEIDAMHKDCLEMEARLKECKENERNARVQSALFQSEARMALSKLLEGNRLVDILAKNQTFAPEKERNVQVCRDQSVEAQQKIYTSEENVQKFAEQRGDISNEIKDNSWELKRLENVLSTAQCYVAQITQEDKSIGGPCASCFHDFGKKLQVLMDILKDEDSGNTSKEISQMEMKNEGQEMEDDRDATGSSK